MRLRRLRAPAGLPGVPGVTLDELALAYELRQEGCCWKRIAQGLGYDPRVISKAVEGAKQRGITRGLDGYPRGSGRPARHNLEQVRAAERMRRQGFTWTAIARELDTEANAIRQAVGHAWRHGLLASHNEMT